MEKEKSEESSNQSVSVRFFSKDVEQRRDERTGEPGLSAALPQFRAASVAIGQRGGHLEDALGIPDDDRLERRRRGQRR